MGYQRPKLRLEFGQDQFDGLEVRMRSISIDQFVELNTLVTSGGKLLEESAEAAEARTRMYELLASGIVEWNLDDEAGVPVPATVDGLRAQDAAFVIALAHAWLSAVAGVPAPLGGPSPDGQPSEEPSIPMEVLSPNPSSL